MISCIDEVGHHVVTSSTLSTSSKTSTKNRQMEAAVGKSFWGEITITVVSNTRGTFNLPVTKYTKVLLIKKVISELIEVSEEQILLLHNHRCLSQGTLKENHISRGCIINFFVLADSGPLSQNPNTIMKMEDIHQSKFNDYKEAKKDREKFISAKNFWNYLKKNLRYLAAQFMP